MRYYIKQKVFSLKAKFDVTDEHENVQYRVEGQMFSLKNRLTLQTIEEQTLFYAEKKIFTFLPEYFIYNSEGIQVARVKRRFTFFKVQFDVFEGNNEIAVDGDFTGHNFSIMKNGSMAASILKKWFTFGDSYEIDVMDDQFTTLYLFLVIIVDQVAEAARRNANSNH